MKKLLLRACLKTPRARLAAADLRGAAPSDLGIAPLFRRACVLAPLDPALASRPRRVLRQALSAAALTLFALPATAMAAPNASSEHGVVLSVGARGREVQVVDSTRVVHAYQLAHPQAGLAAGTTISYRDQGRSITAIQITGHIRKVSYYASVMRTSGRHVLLRLGDGRTVKLATSGARSARVRVRGDSGRAVLAHTASGPTVTINIEGLTPGATVLVTETVGAGGSITISITLPTQSNGSGGGDGSGSGSGATASEPIVGGTVTTIGVASFTLAAASGSQVSFHMDAADLANIGMSICDTVFVQYHAGVAALIADNVDDYGTSNLGTCTGSDGGSDETGLITQIGAGSVTIDTSDQGPLTFAVGPESAITAGFAVGDVVDATYTLDPDGVTLDASDVEYVETDEIGVVTSAGAGALTITDGITGHAISFTADPSEAMFDGIEVGDEVDVTVHSSSGQPVVDNVDDLTDDGTWNG